MVLSKQRWQFAAFWGVVASVAPYAVVKIAWLAGSQVGMRPGTGMGEMDTPRFVIGNILTTGMDLSAVVLALALIQPWGRRLPAWSVIVVAGAATGLLAPILIGVPLGSALQLAIEGSVTSGGEGNLEGWMFAIIYGGFGLMAVALAILLALYADGRWGGLIATGPRPPAHAIVTVFCGVGMLSFAAAMAYWGVFGPGTTGPAAMGSVAQRTVLIVTALAAAGGFLAPLLARGSASRARPAALVTWVGCATTALQGPTGLLLAHDGQASLLGVALAAVATPAAIVYGLAVLSSTLRRRRQALGPAGSPPAPTNESMEGRSTITSQPKGGSWPRGYTSARPHRDPGSRS